MMRIRTKEIHERSWCPELFRDSLTEFLSIVWTVGVYKQAISEINQLVRGASKNTVVDLCSGAGDYIPALLKEINSGEEKFSVVIYKTDLYPNKRFFETGDDKIKYYPHPLAAENAFGRFDALFCMFSALHHFDEPEVLKILYRAAKNKRCIAFFDVSQRRFLTDILANIFLPGMVWAVAPCFKRFSWLHLVFIYLIPVIPLVVFIDGTLSRMRAYKIRELEVLAARVRKRYPDFYIRISEYELLGGMQKVTKITGYPESEKRKIDDFNNKKKNS